MDQLWSRFDSASLMPAAQGIAAAFALVACYDHDVAPAEVERFARLMTPPTSERAQVAAKITQDFTELTQAILQDFDEGRAQALDVIRRFAHDVHARERIIAAAQAAIVADQRLEQREEVALREVCQALGLDPAEY